MTGSGPGGQPLLCSWTENYAGREMYSPGLQVEEDGTYQLIQYLQFLTQLNNIIKIIQVISLFISTEHRA